MEAAKPQGPQTANLNISESTIFPKRKRTRPSRTFGNSRFELLRGNLHGHCLARRVEFSEIPPDNANGNLNGEKK